MIVSPALPSGQDGVRLHLGCGDIDAKGFVNQDLIPLPHIHFLHNVVELPMFGPEEVQLIYACHVIEHLTTREAKRALREWHRVLKPNGVCCISVPDFDKLLEIYRAAGEDISRIAGPLLGSDGLNAHRTVYNRAYLEQALLEAGFSSVRPWSPSEKEWHCFEDWASATVKVGEQRFPISLNLEGVRS